MNFHLNSDSVGVKFIIEYLKSKSVYCEYDFDRSYYFGEHNDVSTISTLKGRIKFIENTSTYDDNEINMIYHGMYTVGMTDILQKLDTIFS
jgi:hypothetical protein